MKTDNLTVESIRKYIPNVLAEVEGETPLFEKLAPFISSAKMWLESEYIGPDDFLSEQHNELALKVLVAKAFLDAVPSLDLVLTPSGFGVISTESMAPASKERIERLTASLDSYIKANLALLVDICRGYKEWRSSICGLYFCSTFFPSLSDYDRYGAKDFHSYVHFRMHCREAECALSEKYLGSILMDELRKRYASGSYGDESSLISSIRRAVLSLIPAPAGRIFDQNRLWHAAEPVIRELNFPENALFRGMWLGEMEDVFDTPAFKNDIKGGFYF